MKFWKDYFLERIFAQFLVGGRGETLGLFKLSYECPEVIKSCIGGHFLDPEVFSLQEFLCLVYFHKGYELHGRRAEVFFEVPAEMVFAQVSHT